MKVKVTLEKIFAQIALVLALIFVIAGIWYSNYLNEMASHIQLKSRYTFSICIDSQGNILDPAVTVDASSHILSEDFADLKINQIGDIWIREFVNQYTQKYLSWSKALKNVKLDETDIIDEEKNTVLISFSAELLNSNSEYFSSWEGILDEGRLICEWVVKFDIDNHYDGTATIYVDSILTPEDYGIYQYNESVKNEMEEENKDNNNTILTTYMLKDSALYVTFDGGGKYIEVPVAYENLLFEEKSDSNAKQLLKYGSYTISTTKTAFVYGGKTVGGERIPVSLLYSDDKGANWVTCEIANIYTADYFYVEFFDEKKGIIVVGYDKREFHESSNIYVTEDGGQTWNLIGTGPANNIIKGVKYVDENIGFFCYDYVDGMDSNLYVTRDSGKTFSKVMFEEQPVSGGGNSTQNSAENRTEASTSGNVNSAGSSGSTGLGKPSNDNSAGNKDNPLTWREIYKEALVPEYDDKQVLTVYLTQGDAGTYNGGNTAAKYQSEDKGITWKYIGEYDINANN